MMTNNTLLESVAAEHERLALGQHAANALLCQDACNLSGVAHTFLAAIQAINDEAHWQGQGTEWRNNHPIVRLFVDKLASLSDMQSITGTLMERYADAYDACKILAGE